MLKGWFLVHRKGLLVKSLVLGESVLCPYLFEDWGGLPGARSQVARELVVNYSKVSAFTNTI